MCGNNRAVLQFKTELKFSIEFSFFLELGGQFKFSSFEKNQT